MADLEEVTTRDVNETLPCETDTSEKTYRDRLETETFKTETTSLDSEIQLVST